MCLSAPRFSTMFSAIFAPTSPPPPSVPTSNVDTETIGDAANAVVATATITFPLMAMYNGQWGTIAIDMEIRVNALMTANMEEWSSDARAKMGERNAELPSSPATHM